MNATKQRVFYDKAIAEGRCPDCGTAHDRISPRTGRRGIRCVACAASRSQDSAAYQLRRMAEGRCTTCGQSHEHISQKTKRRSRLCPCCTARQTGKQAMRLTSAQVSRPGLVRQGTKDTLAENSTSPGLSLSGGPQ